MAKYSSQSFQLNKGEVLTLKHCSALEIASLPAFLKLLSEETTNTLQYKGKTLNLEKAKEAWRQAEKDPRRLYLGAFTADGELVGQVSVTPVNSGHPWLSHMCSFGMTVLKKYWGTGLAQKLLVEMEVFAHKAQFTRIEATVRAKNKRGINFYKRNNYELEGLRKNAAFIDGVYEDEYYLGKCLN